MSGTRSERIGRGNGPASALVALALCAGMDASAQNLLTNASFESGMTGWTTVSSSADTVSYGATGLPGVGVASAIGGGSRMLRDVGGNAIVEQAVSLDGVSPESNLRVGGYFGGGSADHSRLVVRFLDATGTELQLRPLDPVTASHRNFETVLMLREDLLPIPAGAASVAARIEFTNNCCGSVAAAADALFIEPVSGDLVPSPQPSDTELLVNPRFEAGWTAGSPLVLTDTQGWEGASSSSVVVKPYSDADATVVGTIVSCGIGGGMPGTSCFPGGAGNLLSDSGGNGVLRQRIDVRGNMTQFAAGEFALRISAFLGGAAGHPDGARIDVRFLDESLNPTAPQAVGPVTQVERNSEAVLLLREREFFIAPTTAYIEIDVAFTNGCCGAITGLADNISAMLVSPTAPTATPLHTNLVDNASFEVGSLPGSPLQLTNADGWSGAVTTVEVLPYGSSADVPTALFAVENGMGGQLLGDLGGAAVLEQSIDVAADSALIDSGRLRVYASAWLGGVGTSQDMAEMRLTFRTAFGAQVGLIHTLGPVTAADRANQTTLLQRIDDMLIPANARSIDVEVRFTDPCCGGAFALADGIQVVAYDILTGGPMLLPGTDEALRLATGVNGPATSGPGEDVKTASAFDVLSLRIESEDGAFDFSPLVLAANVLPTGLLPTPTPGLPGLVLDPTQLILLIDGFGCAGFGCALVLPGGTHANVLLPPGMLGQSIFLQAFALGGGGGVPANGLFAGSEGHEIRMQ